MFISLKFHLAIYMSSYTILILCSSSSALNFSLSRIWLWVYYNVNFSKVKACFSGTHSQPSVTHHQQLKMFWSAKQKWCHLNSPARSNTWQMMATSFTDLPSSPLPGLLSLHLSPPLPMIVDVRLINGANCFMARLAWCWYCNQAEWGGLGEAITLPIVKGQEDEARPLHPGGSGSPTETL